MLSARFASFWFIWSGDTTKGAGILIFGTVIGMVAGITTTNGTLEFLELHRVHRLSPLLRNAVAKTDPKRDQIILVGQSLSFYGLDGTLVEKLLNQNTNRFQIVQLTVEGVYPIEQDYVLDSIWLVRHICRQRFFLILDSIPNIFRQYLGINCIIS